MDNLGFDSELIESGGGVFEIKANGHLIFSKKELRRFPEEGEIKDLIEGIQSVT